MKPSGERLNCSVSAMAVEVKRAAVARVAGADIAAEIEAGPVRRRRRHVVAVAADAIVEADPEDMLANVGGQGLRGAVQDKVILPVAEIEVEVFDLAGPVAAERGFDAAALDPAARGSGWTRTSPVPPPVVSVRVVLTLP